MSKDFKIMVIGGYGQVGRYICKYLAEMERQVVVAGRNIKKCESFLNELKEPKLESRFVDVTKWKDHYLDEIETVVMATEMNNVEVLEACIRKKVNYVDITPSGILLDEMLSRRKKIGSSGIAVCLGVGIAPGVSNVLCEHLAREFEQISEINSYLMLGIGESHGKNAVKWMVDNLDKCFYENKDSKRMVRSFSDGRNIFLDSKRNKQRYVRLDLADWHIMKEKHAGALVNSWYAYDKNSITCLFEAFQKIGIFRLLKYQRIKTVFTKVMEINTKLMKKIHFGTDEYAIMLEVKGMINGKYMEKRDVLRGRGNSIITAKVCALVADRMSDLQSGLFYMDEIVSRDDIIVPEEAT